jgi:DNA-binding transcriptional MerR regulator
MVRYSIVHYLTQLSMEQPRETRSTTFTIGDLAREFDVTPRAIRFYEDEGLLTPRREGSRRVYSKRDYVRLKLVLRGKRLGLTLAQVREMFELYDSAKDERAQLEKFLAALEARREQLEHQRTEIDEELAEIRAFELQSKKLLDDSGRRARRSTPRPLSTKSSTS